MVIISRIDFSTIPPFYHLLLRLFILVIQNIRRFLNKEAENLIVSNLSRFPYERSIKIKNLLNLRIVRSKNLFQ